MSNWKCDGDRWSYFEILEVVKETKYPEVQEMWYDFAGTLKALEDDFGAIEALNWSKTKRKVDIYIVHPIEQPDLVVALPETLTIKVCEAQPKEQNVEDCRDQPDEQNMNVCGDQPIEENVDVCVDHHEEQNMNVCVDQHEE
ncbi:unnamed protein product [Lathyrus sativus]|nr:unnamed protein product [Lathyrus sativus]